MKLQGSRRQTKMCEDYCDWSKEEIEKQIRYLNTMFVDKFDNPEIIDAFNKLGYPNPVSKEEVKDALRRHYL